MMQPTSLVPSQVDRGRAKCIFFSSLVSTSAPLFYFRELLQNYCFGLKCMFGECRGLSSKSLRPLPFYSLVCMSPEFLLQMVYDSAWTWLACIAWPDWEERTRFEVPVAKPANFTHLILDVHTMIFFRPTQHQHWHSLFNTVLKITFSFWCLMQW